MELGFQGKTWLSDIDAILHPSEDFRHPLKVVRADLTVAEKRWVLIPPASRTALTSATSRPRPGHISIAPNDTHRSRRTQSRFRALQVGNQADRRVSSGPRSDCEIRVLSTTSRSTD